MASTDTGGGPLMCSTKEAARMLGTSEQHVRLLCRGGSIKAAKIGRQWFINRAALLEACGIEDGGDGVHEIE